LVWRGLIPLTLLNLVCVIFVKQFELPDAWLLLASVVLFGGATVVSAQAAKRRVSARVRRSASAAQAVG
jgi:hypothetical protein